MKKNRRIFVYLLLLATLFMSIGYASVNSIILDIEGLLTYKAQEGIYITNINYISSTSTTEENNKIIAGANTLINNSIELSSTDLKSQITYEITLYNSSNEDYAYNDTLYSTNEFFYDNEEIIIETNGINRLDKLEKGKFKTFTITFKYKSDLKIIRNNKLNATINFDFNKLYTITYKNITNNNYRTYAIQGETLQITFINDIPSSVSVKGAESFDYTNPVLNIYNVQSDIEISYSESFELALYTFNGRTDYIDTGFKLFSKENINRDFEITFEIEEFGSNVAFATLINAMDETGSPWPGFTFRYEDSNTGNLEMFTVANGNGRSNSNFLGTSIKKVKIQRINNILYYQYDDGEIEEYFDFTGMTTTFDVPLTIGASLDGKGAPFRYFKGTLSNITFKFLN